MKFVTEKPAENTLVLARKLGYKPWLVKGEEFSCVRPLMRADYPRFHLFIKEHKNKVIFELHLDQKKPSYEGAPAHSGEYKGRIVEKEAERIKNVIETV